MSCFIQGHMTHLTSRYIIQLHYTTHMHRELESGSFPFHFWITYTYRGMGCFLKLGTSTETCICIQRTHKQYTLFIFYACPVRAQRVSSPTLRLPFDHKMYYIHFYILTRPFSNQVHYYFVIRFKVMSLFLKKFIGHLVTYIDKYQDIWLLDQDR